MSTRDVTTSSLEIVNPLYSACTWVRTYNSRCELKIRQNTVQMDSTIHTCTSKKEVVYVKNKIQLVFRCIQQGKFVLKPFII